MIIDNSNGRLDQIKAFAAENNLLENFIETFSLLKKTTQAKDAISMHFWIFLEQMKSIGV